jgi:hypothetical protein
VGYADAVDPFGCSESMAEVEGKPIEQVRAMWAAYARGGVEAMHAAVGDAPVECIPLGADEPVPQEEFWGEWRRKTDQVSVTVHSFEEHGPCVVAHGSMHTFREGGFSDVQPSWVYFFRDGRLLRCEAHASREDALRAIGEFPEAD